MSATWTIRQLCDAVEARLAGEDAPANGQVRAVPDERSIRYYTTLGLLDRPGLRGRTALYGPRHLAQLVAIKRLQAESRTLAEIQQILPTLDDAGLSRLSGVEVQAARRAARRDFWREPETTAEANVESAELPGPTPAAPRFAHLCELTLAPGVRLAFAAGRPVTDADAEALLAAASPLLAELVRRHLAAPAEDPVIVQTRRQSTEKDVP